jgi:hypothetical protein
MILSTSWIASNCKFAQDEGLKVGDIVTWRDPFPDERPDERWKVLEVDRDRALIEFFDPWKWAIRPTKRVNVGDLRKVAPDKPALTPGQRVLVRWRGQDIPGTFVSREFRDEEWWAVVQRDMEGGPGNLYKPENVVPMPANFEADKQVEDFLSSANPDELDAFRSSSWVGQNCRFAKPCHLAAHPSRFVPRRWTFKRSLKGEEESWDVVTITPEGKTSIPQESFKTHDEAHERVMFLNSLETPQALDEAAKAEDAKVEDFLSSAPGELDAFRENP